MTGGSVSLAQGARQRMVLARNREGTLELTERSEAGERQLPVFDDRSVCDIRVSVVSAEGRLQAFLISRYEAVREDTIGPVVDIFAGKVPLQPDDFVIGTDTYRVDPPERVYGEVALERDRWLFVKGSLPDGSRHDFLVDTGGGQTVISRAALPRGVELVESQMVQYSSAGKKMLKYSAGGATGPVESIAGHATLPALRLGSMEFHDVTAAVLDEMPDLFGRPVAGIIGIDLLRRAEFVSLGNGVLRLTPKGGAQAPGSIALPFATVQTHLMVRAHANDHPLSLILDTGAPGMLLDDQAARAAGVTLAGDSTEGRGLDEGSIQLRSTTIARLDLGGQELANVEARAGALPVFATLRVHGQSVGLLGNSLFDDFSKLEIDFVSGMIRLDPSS
jgi:predicted aspartyl protease